MTAPVHNPFQGMTRGGDVDEQPATFDEDRLRRAGLTDDQVDALRGQYDKAGDVGQRLFARHTAQASDDDLRLTGEQAQRDGYVTADRNIETVTADVDRDPQLLDRALESERAGKRRKTLMAHLEAAVQTRANTEAQNVRGPEGDTAHQEDPAPLADDANLTPATDAVTGDVVDDVPASDALDDAPTAPSPTADPDPKG